MHEGEEGLSEQEGVPAAGKARGVAPRAAPAAASSSEELEETKGGCATGATAAAAQGVRAVLVRRMEATVRKVDRLAASWAVSGTCCLFGFARSYKVARRLERANRDVDEIDAARRVEQMVGVVLQHRLK